MKLVIACAALVALATTPAGAQPSAPQSTSMTGKIVDLATYVTRDHNMDAMKTGHAMASGAMKGAAMKGAAMKGDAMKGDAMKGDAMKGDAAMSDACPAMLGIVTTTGRAYPLAFQQGGTTAAAACKHVGSTATLTGKAYTQGGTTVLLVSDIH